MNFKRDGFTLVELVITLVIVAILSIVSYNAYRASVQKAKITEGKTLVSTIANAEDIYYSEHDKYYTVSGWQTTDSVLDLRDTNKYFRYFKVTEKAGGAFIEASTDQSETVGLYVSMQINPGTSSEIEVKDNVTK